MTGNGPEQPKKLAQFSEFKVKEASTNTLQILSTITALDATACATHLKIKIELSGVITFAMIDSSTTKNFITEKFAKNYKISKLLKERPYQLTVFEGKPLN